MSSVPYRITAPERPASCVVFASPHSGRTYARSFLQQSVLDAHEIRSSEDAFVDVLFQSAPDFGAALIQATAPRAYIDLNRSPDELDPALIRGVARGPLNPRVNSGLGVIPRVVAGGRAIYRGKITATEAQSRINQVWYPYHTALRKLLFDRHDQFGQSILIDCHSMPTEAVSHVVHDGTRSPEIVLGDRFGAAADPRIMDQVETAFRNAGLYVLRNAPFAGAYTAQHYGRPGRDQHCIQIEVNRSLYLDETRIIPSPQFEEFRDVLNGVIQNIAGIGAADLPLAAE